MFATNHKLGVICTSYDWCDIIITKEADAAAEIIHVDKALERCRYPKWPFRRVVENMDKKKQQSGARKKKEEGNRAPGRGSYLIAGYRGATLDLK